MRVLCTLPNASESINGVAFEAVPGGMLSETIDATVAAHFLRIPGYQRWSEPEPLAEPAKPEQTEQPVRRRGRP